MVLGQLHWLSSVLQRNKKWIWGRIAGLSFAYSLCYEAHIHTQLFQNYSAAVAIEINVNNCNTVLLVNQILLSFVPIRNKNVKDF
jgi:hypothetical protein